MLGAQLSNLSTEEKEWKDIKEKLAMTAVEGKVNLNVGGDRYTTNVQTLIREKDTFFTALFSKQWKLELDPDDKSIFIDRDGKLFGHILNYLRTNYIPDDLLNNESLRQLLIIEAKYFCLHQLIDRLTEPDRKKEEERQTIESYFAGGTLLQIEHKKKLNEFYGKAEQKWALIYKATRDGFSADAFHNNCDGKGSTMTVILCSSNYLFGGYRSIPWTSGAHCENDTTVFVFTLISPNNIAPTKYLVDARNGVFYYPNCGPTFSHVLYIGEASNENGNSFAYFPYLYIQETGKTDDTSRHCHSFTTADIEVYQIV